MNNKSDDLLKECLVFLEKDIQSHLECRELAYKISLYFDVDNTVVVEDMAAPCPSYCPSCTGNGDTHSKVYKRIRKDGAPPVPRLKD